MPVHSSLTRSAVIARLRAAGCVFAEDEAELLLAAPFSHSELTAAVRAAGLRISARTYPWLGRVLRSADFGGFGVCTAQAHGIPC